MRRQFEYKCPTRRECQPDSSTREDRLPRALLSAHFVRHRQKPRSPERPDPPIAPFDIVHRCTYFRTFVPNLRTHALYRMSDIMCLFCIRSHRRFSTWRMDLQECTSSSFFFYSNFSTISILTLIHVVQE